LVVTITKSSGSGYAAKMDSLDQGSTIPVDTITVSGDAVRLELKAIGGVYEGTLNKDRTEMTGKWSQGGSLPLTLKLTPPSAAATPSAKPAATERPLTVLIDVRAMVAPTAFQAQGKT